MDAASAPLPRFELDRRADYGPCFIDNPNDIALHLRALASRASLASAYLDDGRQFFLTTVLAVDEHQGTLLLDPSQDATTNDAARAATQTTLVVTQDRIKLELRVGKLQTVIFNGREAFAAPLPATLLRLQRREFFRLEPPIDAPIHCQLRLDGEEGAVEATFQLADLSVGGIGLIAPPGAAGHFPRDALFRAGLINIPNEPAIVTDMRVRKAIELSNQAGESSLRVGCEFLGLRGAPLAIIERYISRIARERSARASGLAI